MASLCQACSQLKLNRSDFTSPPFEPEGRYQSVVRNGTFGDLRSTRASCGICGLIWHAMDQSSSVELAEAEDSSAWSLVWAQSSNDFEPDGTVDDIEDSFGSALYPCFGSDETRRDYGIQLIDDNGTTSFLRGNLVPDRIDPETVRRWISRCQNLHGEACVNTALASRPLSASSLSSLTVIDVEQMRLCKLPTGEKYSALSYVWGDHNRPVSLKANQKGFSQARGLDIALPQTIVDAIEVSRAIGLRFIWIDSLCIVQDESIEKQALIDNMDSVYSSAVIALVAATGTSANAGLSGWSNREQRKQETVALENNLRLGVLPYYQRELLECAHAYRAWTYQETCFAPRCLVFLNGFVYFNCNAAVYPEHTFAEVDGISPETSANALGKTLPESVLQQFSQHVASYTSRKLKYQSDGVNAFSGIAQSLSNKMSVNQLCYGMPASCFDWAILWSGLERLQRRPNFPSWSWVGWEGATTMPQMMNGEYDQRWLLRGTWIDWYLVNRDGTCQPLWDSKSEGSAVSLRLEEIMSDVSDQQVAKAKAVSEESENTGAESDQEDDAQEPEPCPTYGHSTSSNPFGRNIHPEILRMIPMPPNPTAASHFDLCVCDAAIALCFSAPKIDLTAGSPTVRKETSGEAAVCALNDEKGRTCGFLFIDNNDAWSLSSGSTVKLLLVSVTSSADLSSYHYTGRASTVYETCGEETNLQEYLESGIPADLDHFDFLNVLAVRETGQRAELVRQEKREDVPVHERAGVGFVHRTVLQGQALIWDNLVLG